MGGRSALVKVQWRLLGGGILGMFADVLVRMLGWCELLNIFVFDHESLRSGGDWDSGRLGTKK